MSETLEQKLKKIEEFEGELLRKLTGLIAPGGDMHLSHALILGAAKRTLALADGFRLLVRARNFLCAAPLVRMQLDTAFRVFAGTLVADSEAYARAVFEGARIDKLRDRHGTHLRDAYLVQKFSEAYPWVTNVYRETSGLVHFTGRHIFAGVCKVDDEQRIVHFMVSAQDPPRPDEDYFEVVDCFFEAMRVTGIVTLGWATARQAA